MHRHKVSSDKFILLYICFLFFFRRQCDDLQERTKYISNKEKLLTAKIMEVKLTLAEVRNRNAAGKGKNWMSMCR